MPMKRYKAEQIVTLLRQIEVGIANGKPTPQACKEAEITIQTYYRWRKEYGGLKLDQGKRLKELEKENAKLKRVVAELSLEKQVLSERHACRLVNQWRGTQRYLPIQRVDEDALTRAIITLASEYGRYGYRRITALLRTAGWQVGKDRVQRIWRREGLKIPKKQKPRRRLWFNDGSCVRLRPERANHVWSYDFVSAMTHDGRTIR